MKPSKRLTSAWRLLEAISSSTKKTPTRKTGIEFLRFASERDQAPLLLWVKALMHLIMKKRPRVNVVPKRKRYKRSNVTSMVTAKGAMLLLLILTRTDVTSTKSPTRLLTFIGERRARTGPYSASISTFLSQNQSLKM
jgi:hypothetical protein